MILHYLKLLWKRRNSNLFLFLELIITFFILIVVFQYGINKMKFYKEPLGFETQHQYLVSLVADDLHEDSLRFFQLMDNSKKALKSLQFVKAVSIENAVIPYGNSQWSTGGDDGFSYNTEYTMIDDEGGEAWQIPFNKGKFFSKEDLQQSRLPIVVNQKFVDVYMKGKEPIGFQFVFGPAKVQIVGVAKAFKYRGDFRENNPFTFVPFMGNWQSCNNLIVRVNGEQNSQMETEMYNVLKKELNSDEFVIQKMSDIKRSYNNNYWVPIIGMISVTIFLIINIALGLFGSLRYAINRRRSEIGLRKVVGATVGDIRFQIVGEILLLMFLALLVALIPAVQIVRFGNFNIDTTIFYQSILVSFVLITVLLLICSLWPSQKIAKLPPAVALHED